MCAMVLGGIVSTPLRASVGCTPRLSSEHLEQESAQENLPECWKPIAGLFT